MSVERIASRYAKSLLDLATEQNKLERVKEDMEYFLAAARVRDLALLLKSPIVHTSTKRKVFNRLFAEQFDKLTTSFLEIILRKGRESYLAEIAEAFMELYREVRQISQVRLTTAVPLSDEKLAEIRQKIAAANVTRSNIELETKVDPKIMGGFILEFSDKLYDASVAHQLESMRRALMQTGFETNN